MKKLLCILAVALFVLTACNAKESTDTSDVPGEQSQIENTEQSETVSKTEALSTEEISEPEDETTMTIGIVEADVFEIKTDYCSLKYPNKWKEEVTVEVKDNTVSFTHTATDTRVFDIVFGDGDGYVLGTVKGENEDIIVRISDYDLDKESPGFQAYCAIIEDVNVIINHLSTDYDFELGN